MPAHDLASAIQPMGGFIVTINLIPWLIAGWLGVLQFAGLLAWWIWRIDRRLVILTARLEVLLDDKAPRA